MKNNMEGIVSMENTTIVVNMKMLAERVLYSACAAGALRRFFAPTDLGLVSFAIPYIQDANPAPYLMFPLVFCTFFNPEPSVALCLGTLLGFDAAFLHSWGRILRFFLGSECPRVRLGLILAVFAVSEAAALRHCSVNTRRKLFHLAAFFGFLRVHPVLLVLCQYVLYFLLWAESFKLGHGFLRRFASERDIRDNIVSHIVFLGALVYPRFFLGERAYQRHLIALCILDSAASVYGTSRKYRRKSFGGFVAGQMAAYCADFLLHGEVLCRYFFLVGLAEWAGVGNDNIAIPLVSVLYFRG